MANIDQLPGFRRRFSVTAGADWSCAEVEDDFHCMAVMLRHDGGVIGTVEPIMDRAPWTTCPGAVAQLQQTFTGVTLGEVVARGDKSANCTHLYDLVVLAAAHATAHEPLIYDILVSDPVDGRREAEVRRNGQRELGWIEREQRIVEPEALAGLRLDQLRPWIDSLDARLQEPARLLRWGAMLAHGRTIPMERQSDAARMPPNCYTFQPERARHAQRVGEIREFSRGAAEPLDRSVNPHTATAAAQDSSERAALLDSMRSTA